jgi:hypothetical protein
MRRGPIIIQAVVPVFPDDSEESSRHAFSNKSTAFTRGRSSSMPKAELRVEGRRVLVDGLTRTTTGSCSAPLE